MEQNPPEHGPPSIVVDGISDQAMGELVYEILKIRRRRGSLFDDGLFGEPAWDILLELYAARLSGHGLSITSAGEAAEVSPTTSLRWANILIDNGWARREKDEWDARRSWLIITDKGAAAMRELFGNSTVRAARRVVVSDG